MTYAEKLKDPRWQKKRLEIMQLAEFACEECGDKESTLHVHHRYYVKSRYPWQYPNFALRCICSQCHDDSHAKDVDASDFSLEEWEIEADWILGGQNAAERLTEGVWDFAAEFCQLADLLGKRKALSLCVPLIAAAREEIA